MSLKPTFNSRFRDPRKADLVDGKVPLEQLPNSVAGETPDITDLRGNGTAAANGAYAGGDQLVVGSDPRMGLRGGVTLAGESGANPGNGSPTAIPVGDFTMIVDVIPSFGPGLATGIFGATSGAFNMGFGHESGLATHAKVWVDPTVGNFFGASTGIICSDLIGRRCTVAFERIAGVWGVWFNNVKLTISGTIANDTSPFVDRLLGGSFGGFGQFPGFIKNIWILGQVLTPAQHSAVASGNTPAGVNVLATYLAGDALKSGNWPDSTINCRDLVAGTGVTATSPKDSHTRRIAVTCSGSGAIGANASASVGTLVGITLSDTAAIAAIKAGDAVSAQFGSSMPANIVALVANCAVTGTAVVRAHADATGGTVAAGTVINLIHTQS